MRAGKHNNTCEENLHEQHFCICFRPLVLDVILRGRHYSRLLYSISTVQYRIIKMSLLYLPDDKLAFIFECIMKLDEDNPLPHFLSLASTCKRLAQIAVKVLKDIEGMSPAYQYEISPSKYDHDEPGKIINFDKKLALRRRSINPCPIHSIGDRQCYYEQLTPLVQAKWINFAAVEFSATNFFSGRCIFTADIKWDRITKIALSVCCFDLETLRKLLSKLENLAYLALDGNTMKIRGAIERQLPAIRRELKEILFDTDDENILTCPCIKLPAKIVNIHFSEYEIRLPTSYLRLYQEHIELLKILVNDNRKDLTTAFGRQLYHQGLADLKYKVYRN